MYTYPIGLPYYNIWCPYSYIGTGYGYPHHILNTNIKYNFKLKIISIIR